MGYERGEKYRVSSMLCQALFYELPGKVSQFVTFSGDEQRAKPLAKPRFSHSAGE